MTGLEKPEFATNRDGETVADAVNGFLNYAGTGLVGETRLEGEVPFELLLSTLTRPVVADEFGTFMHAVRAFGPSGGIERDRGYDFDRPDRRSLRVLVAEDNPVNRKVTAKILERVGHKPYLVNDGDKALDALEELAFDIALLDVNMPGTSGLDVTKLYRFAHLGEPRLPIIALTAKAMKGDQERCIEAGANDYLPKPVDETRLYSMMRVWLYR